MDPATMLFIASMLKKAFDEGMSVYNFLQEIEQTGVVPQEAWDEMAIAFDDADQFWSSVAEATTDPAA